MRISLLFLMLFSTYSALAQLNEGFADGDFSNNPAWTGSNSGADFTIVSNQLRSNSTTINSNFYLSTANALATGCTWEFSCSLQFATSGANYVDVYLVSNQANLQSSNINGYFIRIGNTDDEISLYKRNGSASGSTKIIDGANSSVSSSSNNVMSIRVSRSSANVFTLERDMTGGTNYFTEGTVTDAAFTSTTSFGVFVQQSTASFVQKHFFDDFKIAPIVVDNISPKLVSATAIDTVTVEATFDEAMDSTAAKARLNYSLSNGYGNPLSVSTTSDAAKYMLKYASLVTGSYTLTSVNVKDRNNNSIAGNNTASFNYIKPYIAKANDVVINEIFADPTPQVGLPNAEFIELWNTTAKDISLKNWKYSNPSTTATLPGDTIHAGEHLIFCAKADTTDLKLFGRTIGLSPWPSLNNAGDNLTLKNEQGTTIYQVTYTDNWYKDAAKKPGGWSLELIDPLAVCSGIQNWAASKDTKGGTPGKQNSQYKSNTTTEALKLLSASLTDSVTLTLTFNRAVDSLSASSPAKYALNNGVGSPSAVLPIGPDFLQVQLKFTAALARGNTYKATVSNLTDCIGIIIAATANSVEFIYPKKITKNSILVNEILFNPRASGADFVEIYNSSGNVFDLKELSVATLAKGKDSLVSIRPLSAAPLLMQPRAYLVLTTDPDNIKQVYTTSNPNAFLKMASMPAFNNDEGAVVLLSGTVRVDQFNYSEKMHLALIRDYEGISLERSSFVKPANEPGNFRSAAADVGYATPGYKNSQSADDIPAGAELFLTSKSFSPDNDGFEDLLEINYHFPKPGILANAFIYTDKGILVHRLAKNLTLSTQGKLTWDGTGEFKGTQPVGIYMLDFEVFDLDGKVKKYRKNFVLATKLN